jgi:hypothetical protein
MSIRKENTKLFTDYKIVYVGKLKETTKKLLELMSNAARL